MFVTVGDKFYSNLKDLPETPEIQETQHKRVFLMIEIILVSLPKSETLEAHNIKVFFMIEILMMLLN